MDIVVGAFILFILRQLIYRNRFIEKTQVPKNPGSRLLFIFIIFAVALFILDFAQDMSFGFKSLAELHFLFPIIRIPIFRGLYSTP